MSQFVRLEPLYPCEAHPEYTPEKHTWVIYRHTCPEHKGAIERSRFINSPDKNASHTERVCGCLVVVPLALWNAWCAASLLEKEVRVVRWKEQQHE